MKVGKKVEFFGNGTFSIRGRRTAPYGKCPFAEILGKIEPTTNDLFNH
jgi:hypothetical protein